MRKNNNWEDINYIQTSIKGSVILRAGKDNTKRMEFYDVSLQVPVNFAKTILKWKRAYDPTFKVNIKEIN